ncbi:unnamed protein product [Pipistrellus nathusii]|uniref:Vertnin n=1 Tax=Pipistrellus nathusii TaxID=59473 RepID=A0ABN9Z5E3_PIPNA
MTSREQLVQQVLQELQEAVEAEGLEGLVGAALEAKQVLSSFALPSCREGGPGRQVLEVDSVALSLYPEDAPRSMLPLRCRGGGSLLFEAASTLLWGDAGLSLELRARTVVEMLLHRQYYLQGMIDSKVMLQAVRYSLCSEESPEMTSLPPATLEAIFDADVKATCFPDSFSNVWHLYALASVLQRNIYSIYPMRNLRIRPYFNRIIRPRRCDHVPATLHIMWAGQPLTRHLFRHQYFAPVVGLEEVEVEAEDASCLASAPPASAPPAPGPSAPPAPPAPPAPAPPAAAPAPAPVPPAAKTPELLPQEPGLSYSHFRERYSVTKSTFYRWRRQSQEHQQKLATLCSAKRVLQDSAHRGGIMSLQQFLQRFPDISRSTYYAWKNELLGPGACQPPAPKEEPEQLPEEPAAQGLGCSLLPVSSPGMVLMQRAKLYLEHCISLNTLVPYRCFKRRFPGISRSTYYNWRRKALRRNPNFKPGPALPTAQAPQPAAASVVGEEALLPEKAEVGEGPGKATGVVGASPTPQEFLPPRVPLSRRQKRLRRAARKQVLSGHLPFCRFRLRYPSLSPSAFWVWKSLARGWPRSLSKLQAQAPPASGKRGMQEAEAKREEGAGRNVAAAVAPAAAPPGEDPGKAQGGPSRERALPEGAPAQGWPHSGSWPSQPVAAAAGGRDSQMLMMDMLATTKFKAQAKLFLQQCFQSKSFPSYKEFSALFPLTARSTYYMWKRALFDGLTLVDS